MNKMLTILLTLLPFQTYSYTFDDLLNAILDNNKEWIEAILNLQPELVNAQGEDDTALIYAIYHNKLDTIKYLIEKGADINAQDSFGNTALIWAMHDNNLEIVKLLYYFSNPKPSIEYVKNLLKQSRFTITLSPEIESFLKNPTFTEKEKKEYKEIEIKRKQKPAKTLFKLPTSKFGDTIINT